MGGYTPQARHGLIALLAARRVKAEKARRALAAKARTPEEREAAAAAEKQTKRSGWFR
ncbi:hypothetical protein [Brevundimonas sp.]|jgi:hypothetical protein|uniref:hypothetical protein n=1 Tax=Brevundimonas sp. TaxID=1871086 RepID=UPI001AC0F6A3|nr:hypothetical protein [Caulobacterales bacterium]